MATDSSGQGQQSAGQGHQSVALQSQAGSRVPRDLRERIREWYPDLAHRPHCLPHVYLHSVKHETRTLTSGVQVNVPKAPVKTLPPAAGPAFNTRSRRKRKVTSSGEPHEYPLLETDLQNVKATQHVTHCMPKTGAKRKGNMTSSSCVPNTFPLLETDVDNVKATQHVTHCVRALAETLHKELGDVMFILTQLEFGDYLGQPSYAAAFRQTPFPRPCDLPDLADGDLDMVLIHGQYALRALELKSVGMTATQRKLNQQDLHAELLQALRKMLRMNKQGGQGQQPTAGQQQVMGQLERTRRALTYIVSDLQPAPRVKVTLVLPYISGSTLRAVLGQHSDVRQALCRDMDLPVSADPVDHCLLADHLSDRLTPHDVTDDVIQSLRGWWSRCVSGAGSDPAMSEDVYEELVARFVGPATVVRVHHKTEPRLEVTDMRTEGHYVSEVGDRLTALALFPYQVDLIHTAPDLAFLVGPPGTGKTLTLVVMALEWLRQHKPHPQCQQHQQQPPPQPSSQQPLLPSPVHIISLWKGSRAVSHHIKQQLEVTARQTLGPQAADQVHIHLVNWYLSRDTERAAGVADLVRTIAGSSREGTVNVIVDEAVRSVRDGLDDFYRGLVSHPSVSRVRLWAASLELVLAPKCLQGNVYTMTHPLRSPPAVTREIALAEEFRSGRFPQYTEPPAPPPCDASPVLYVRHKRVDHIHERTVNCEACGMEVGRILRDLGVGQGGSPSSSNRTPLQYRDVFLLWWTDFEDEERDASGRVIRHTSGIVHGLRQAGVPVRVVKYYDDEGVADMGTMSGPDAVTAAFCWAVHGLERKIVVLVGDTKDGPFDRLNGISRATSQVVWVKPF